MPGLDSSSPSPRQGFGPGVLPRSWVSVRLRSRRLVVSFHLLFVVLFVPGSVRRCNTSCHRLPLLRYMESSGLRTPRPPAWLRTWV